MEAVPPYLGNHWVDASQTIGQAGMAVVRSQCAAILARREGTLDGEDPEELHQMRVACRRLRTAVRLFAAWLPPETETLRTEAGWIGSVLGPVRDADVQTVHLDSAAEGWPEDVRAAAERLRGWIVGRREQARSRMTEELRSDRWFAFENTVRAVAPLEPPAGCPPVQQAGAEVIRRRYRAVRRRVRALEPGQEDALFHEARIAAKKARYAMEFLAPVFGPEAKACAKRLADLQDHLGLLQDRSVARGWVREAVADLPGQAFGLGYVLGAWDREAAWLKDSVSERWKPVREAWRKLREVLPRPAEEEPGGSPNQPEGEPGPA
ncbi:MAG: CHAD domain-containing protein [Fimbriimonadales bacterium]|nr:CHAD domain-containing protein [Fimbriimonadales bacterium]